MKMQLFLLEVFFGVSLIVLFISIILLVKLSKQPRPKETDLGKASQIIKKKKETHLTY